LFAHCRGSFRRAQRGRCATGVAIFGALTVSGFGAPARAQTLDYATIAFGDLPTFVTGIRGDTVTGQYVLPSSGGSANGGFLYSNAAASFMPFPAATANGVNFPGAIDNTPYGPSFGSPGGILRVVGSYQTAASAPFGLGYLYDSAAPPGTNITTLQYPNPPGDTTLFTIAHSTFGDQVVGNYDTRLVSGNAFIYDISTGTYTSNNKPGAISTTAYGVWGNLIAGGYAQAGGGSGPALGHGYIYDQTTHVWATYDYPGAVETHFEGISGGGRAGSYNLVADWLDAQGQTHAAVLHLDAAGNATWINISVPGANTTSANSIYGDEVIGVYTSSSGVTQGFAVEVAGIYSPIENSGTLATSAAGTPAISGMPGDDVLNTGLITTSGANSAGISSDTYGVVTNEGQVTVSGAGSAAVLMNGTEGTLLNYGVLQATNSGYAIATGATASGSVVVNYGTIDGPVLFLAGALGRFENSGWLGITASGTGGTHVIAGTFAQTGSGTLALRVDQTGGHDALQVQGSAQFAGTLTLVPQSGLYVTPVSYSNLITTTTMWGSFGTVDASSPFFQVSLIPGANSFGAELTRIPFNGFSGLTPNQAAVAGALEQDYQVAVASGAGTDVVESVLAGSGTASEVPAALDALSGAGLAGIRQTTFTANAGFVEAMRREGAFWLSGEGVNVNGAANADPPGAPLHAWGVGMGATGELDGNPAAGTASLSMNSGVVAAGLEYRPMPDVVVGAALGGVSSGYSVGSLRTNGDLLGVETGLYALGRCGGFYASGAVAFGGYAVDSTRDVSALGITSTDKSSFDESALTGRIETGYVVKTAVADVTPFAAYEGSALWEPAFSESVQGSPFGLAVEGQTTASQQLSAGIDLDHAVPLSGAWTLQNATRAAWAHEFDTERGLTARFEAAPTASFFVIGAPAASDSALLSDIVSFARGQQLSVFAAFDGEMSGVGHMVGARLGFRVAL
jgi:uncharacterized protein with beta-barrel porin domain